VWPVWVVLRVSAACADLLSKLSAQMLVLAWRGCVACMQRACGTGTPRSKDSEVEVKNASLLSSWKEVKELPVKFELISSYSFYTVSLGISTVAEEGCLELLFDVATKIFLCREKFFVPCWY
jgi:hypothetical protein